MDFTLPLLEDEELLLHIARDDDTDDPLYFAVSDQRVYFATRKSFRLSGWRIESVPLDEIRSASIARVSNVGTWLQAGLFLAVAVALIALQVGAQTLMPLLAIAAACFLACAVLWPRAVINRRALRVRTAGATFYWKGTYMFTAKGRAEIEAMFQSIAALLRDCEIRVDD